MISTYFFIFLFSISMIAAVLRKNVIMAISCLYVGNISAVMFIYDLIGHGESGLNALIYSLFIVSVPVVLLGAVLVINYFKESKSILTGEMKSWME